MAADAPRFRVDILPMFSDNYAYLLRCTETGASALVDPASPKEVLQQLGDLKDFHLSTIEMILTTHGHYDHAGGNEEMVQALGKKRSEPIAVYGGRKDDIPALTNPVQDDDEIKLGKLTLRGISTPCHTPGSVCYLVQDPTQAVVFTGDTLFNFGCGRFNSGTGEQMHAALDRLAALASSTLVYSGHEYTVNNLVFASSMEPNNQDASTLLDWAKSQRSEGLPTVPTTIQQELKANPFMRWAEEGVRKACNATDDVSNSEVVALLRKKKNSFGLGAGRR